MENTLKLVGEISDLAEKCAECDSVEGKASATVLHTLAGALALGHGQHLADFCTEYSVEMAKAIDECQQENGPVMVQ